MAEYEYKSPERLLLDDLNLWSGAGRETDMRARFSFVRSGNVNSFLLRNIEASIDRDGNRDWLLTYTDPYEPHHTWTTRSDTSTGAVLTMIARMCGLDGEIRGLLPETDEGEAP